MELFSSKFIKLLIFQEELTKPQKQTKILLRRNFVSLEMFFAILTVVKHREIYCEANLN